MRNCPAFDLGTGSQIDPTRFWATAETALQNMLMQFALDLIPDRDEAQALIAALTSGQEHPHKSDFIAIAYPVVKAWCALREANARMASPASCGATRH